MGLETSLELVKNISLFLTLPWVILVLLSTFLDACVGYLDEWLLKKVGAKKHSAEIDAPGQLILISGLFGLVVSAVVIIVVLFSPLSFIITKESFLFAFAAGMLEVLWLIPYFYAMDRSGALNTTPLFQAIPIFSLALGLIFFGEVPSTIHFVAAILILSGGFLLNYVPSLRKLEYHTIGLMLMSSCIISLGYFFFKDAAVEANFVTALLGNGLGMGFLSIAIWLSWRPYRQQFFERVRAFDKKIIFLQTANEGLYALASFLNQAAIVLGPTVMVVSAFSAFHPVFTLIIGAVLARLGWLRYEKKFAGVGIITKVTAILTITFGTLLISLN